MTDSVRMISAVITSKQLISCHSNKFPNRQCGVDPWPLTAIVTDEKLTMAQATKNGETSWAYSVCSLTVLYIFRISRVEGKRLLTKGQLH